MEKHKSILCIGGLHFDRLAQSLAPYRAKASNPVRYSRAAGGVAHNIACDMVKLGTPCAMVSLVGGDADGADILEDTTKQGVNVDLVVRNQALTTASYTAVLDEAGELATGLSDTATYEAITPAFLEKILPKIQKFNLWVIDANLSAESITWLGKNKGPALIFAAPVSPSKALRWKDAISNVDVFIGNEREADIIANQAVETIEDALSAARAIRKLGPKIAVITLGPRGGVVSSEEIDGYFAIPDTKVVDVNGAGDAFFGGFCQAFNKGLTVSEAMSQGIATASLMAETPGPIRPDLSLELVAERVDRLPPYIKFD